MSDRATEEAPVESPRAVRRAFDILFLVDDGIGNVIELLYAVEYCIRCGKRTGLHVGGVSPAFQRYLVESYGDNVVIASLSGVSTTHLVHSWLYEGPIPVRFDNYIYVNANAQSTLFQSETEQYLSIVRALFPSGGERSTLEFLRENYSSRVKDLSVQRKYVLYPGCDSRTPSKRWPYFAQLIEELGADNVLVVGGRDDLDFQYSFYYPRWVTLTFPSSLRRKRAFFNALKSLRLLSRHSHINELKSATFAYFGSFTWPELTALLRRAGAFIGNDGGLSQLAGACGASGVVIFGPSSVSKNRPYNCKLRPLTTDLVLPCQPCQFRVNGVDSMAKQSILCPVQVKCLYSISARQVSASLRDTLAERNVGSPAMAGASNNVRED